MRDPANAHREIGASAPDQDEARNAHLLTLSNILAERLDGIRGELAATNRLLRLLAFAGLTIAGAVVFALLRGR
jgi:hypothetical protein